MDFAQAAEILGLKGGELSSDIKKKYKKFVLKYHPDRYQSESAKKQAEKRLKEINEAYQYIMDNADECFDTTARKKTTQNPLQFDDDFYWRKDEIYKILYEFEEIMKKRKNRFCNNARKDSRFDKKESCFYDYNKNDDEAEIIRQTINARTVKEIYAKPQSRQIWQTVLEISGIIIMAVFYLILWVINKELEKE